MRKLIYTDMIDPSLITYDEHQASEILGFTVKTLQQRRWAGKPPRFLKVGRLVRYRQSDLLDFLNSATIIPRNEL